ncbi:hypothetical protein LDBUL1632_01164 [Lactobacillus delbrueckii subsp. bulgaricus CNCM I-1632]|nr:hypothetical protein LDBUL1632_01164 [Lactobacillus delbrueckii subsp. bulgaricus CNCM I-1632]
MTEAAKELFIAQPTLSSAIKQLEKNEDHHPDPGQKRG